ncbi:Dagla [Symbiodinium natans]|uniref:sn-1-specific diacylglycerol lipase n=1 Tax=Symbiodinium natans TaxID=878477 RepID=A0A812M626_9DINO|nr:Dagla [Symbiodinium natans]
MADKAGESFLRLSQSAATTATKRLSQLGTMANQALKDGTQRPCVHCGQERLRATMYECTECRQLCCWDCVVMLPSLPGPSAAKRPLKLCQGCVPLLKKRVCDANIQLRVLRLEAFLADKLEPFTYDPESKLDQSLRLSGHVMTGLKQVSGFLPLGQVAQAIKAGYYLVRYGPLILAGNEIMESFQLIVGLARKLEIPAYGQLLSPDFFAGLYYTMGEHWGQRGRTPHLEALAHTEPSGGIPSPDRGTLLTLRHLTRLLLVSKEPSPTDAQRLLRQAMPGSELLLAELSSASTIPSFFLVCSRTAHAAYLVLPGTRNPADLATDFNAAEEPFGDGLGHRGMVQSAQWLMEEMGSILIQLYTEGYRVTIVGHSLGAGVGALLTLMLRPHISTIFCYGFGTPACVDEALLPSLLTCMVSVVNRDDIVPRLSVRSVQELVDSVLCPGQVAKTQAWMKEDWQAVKDLERVVELRRRGGPSTEGAPDSSDAGAAQDEEQKLMILMEAGVERTRAIRALRAENGDLNGAMLRATAEEVASDDPGPEDLEQPSAPAAPAAASAASALGRLGGLWQEVSQKIPFPSAPSGIQLGPRPPAPEGSAKHTEFFIPGQVVHLYRHNGLARAALAAPSHEALRRIVPSQEMLHDHKLESYALALHQACVEVPRAPTWESFDQRELCACCGSDFAWAFVLQSEAQKMLSRHHCLACGRVVCDGCSRKRLAHANLGFTVPVRTCILSEETITFVDGSAHLVLGSDQ